MLNDYVLAASPVHTLLEGEIFLQNRLCKTFSIIQVFVRYVYCFLLKQLYLIDILLIFPPKNR